MPDKDDRCVKLMDITRLESIEGSFTDFNNLIEFTQFSKAVLYIEYVEDLCYC